MNLRSLFLIAIIMLANKMLFATDVKLLLQTKKINLNVSSNDGYHSLRFVVENISNQSVNCEIAPGEIFQSDDERAQNLIVMVAKQVVIQPQKSSSFELLTNCIEPNDYAPHLNTNFKINTVKNEKLSGLAAVANANNLNGFIQTYMWMLARSEKELVYSKEDSTSYWPVIKYLGNYMKLSKYKAPEPPKPKYVYSIRASVAQNMEKNQKLTLLVLSEDNKIIKTFFENKEIPAGVYAVSIGYNEVVEDTTLKVKILLKTSDNVVLKEKLYKNHQFDPKSRIFLHQTMIEYEVDEILNNVSMYLLGPDNQIITTLYRNKTIQQGIRKSPYSFYHTYPAKSKFKVRIVDANNKPVKEFELAAGKESEVK